MFWEITYKNIWDVDNVKVTILKELNFNTEEEVSRWFYLHIDDFSGIGEVEFISAKQKI